MKKRIAIIVFISLMWVQTIFAGEIVKAQTIYASPNFSKTVNKTILALEERYPNSISVFEIGKSVQGESILALEVGKGPKQILINATHHARESLTTVLTLDQIDYIAKLSEQNGVSGGSNVRALLDKVTIVFVPLLNPDGANLVLNGGQSISPEFQGKGHLKPSLYPSWKANINGVDLNVNYPTSRPGPVAKKWPSSEGYKGPTLLSEPETKQLVALCEERLFDGSISYHSSGEIIFWHFNQQNVARDQKIAQAVSKATGYRLVGKSNPTIGNGFKDWFVEKYQKPGLTIEISPYVGSKAVPISRYQSIWEKNKNVPIIFASQVNSAVTRKTPYTPKPIEPQEPIKPEIPTQPLIPQTPDLPKLPELPQIPKQPIEIESKDQEDKKEEDNKDIEDKKDKEDKVEE